MQAPGARVPCARRYPAHRRQAQASGYTRLRRRLSPRCSGRSAVEGSWALISEQDWPWTGIVRRINASDRPGIVLDAPEDATASAQEFSPDGPRIAVVEHTHAGPARIAVYQARTWRRLRALTDGHYDTHPVWSPDGRWIAFSRDPENPGDGLGTDLAAGLRAGDRARGRASRRRPPARGRRRRSPSWRRGDRTGRAPGRTSAGRRRSRSSGCAARTRLRRASPLRPRARPRMWT